jgi:DegT/DnrJ/EryC1/StrS aminotransferase family
VSYNPWPLGNLPESWRRPEPQLLREAGIEFEDPREIVTLFEQKLARFSGSNYAVLTDTCSHALFLSLKYRGVSQEVKIPQNTYVSVPMQIYHAGAFPRGHSVHWSGEYRLGDTDIIDAAGRFRPNMYPGGKALQCLSFQIKKRIPIGKGGAILTNDAEAYNWLKLSSYDGRNLATPYDSPAHIEMLGWHYYMTPEDAARGILLMQKVIEIGDFSDVMSWQNYPNWTQMLPKREGKFHE